MNDDTQTNLRKLNVYDSNYVECYKSKIYEHLLKDLTISCIVGTKGHIVIATTDGHLLAIDKFFDRSLFNLKAFDGVITQLLYSRKRDILFVVGVDKNLSLNNTLKVYDLTTLTNDSPIPTLLNSTLLTTANKKKSMIMSVTVDEKLNFLVVGYDDGTVAIISNDIVYMRKHKIHLIKEFKAPITGLSIVEVGSQSNTLFITTTECVAVYDMNPKDSTNKCIILDRLNVPLKCSSAIRFGNENQLVVATTQAIQSYTQEGRCHYIRLKDEKSFVKTTRDTVIFVSNNSTDTIMAPNMFHGNKQKSESYTINIVGFNTSMKFFAFEKQVTSPIIDIVYEWGCFYVFLHDGQLLRIVAKDFESRLNFLCKKNLYTVALSMAKDSSDHRHVVECYRKYGDYLYSQGDMKNSMKQFIETIGFLEPSYVIHKFLDTHNMNHVTAYLEKLHELNLALVEHTTLLLNCYIKLNDIDNLEKFLDKQNDIYFDLQTAIRVCHQAKLYNHALKLSKKSHNILWHLKILIEDIHDYDSAMEFVSSCSSLHDLCDCLKKYGKILLHHLPQKILDCIKKIVVVYPDCDIQQFLHIFVGDDAHLKELLEFIIKNNSKCEHFIYNRLMELYINEYVQINDPAQKIQHELKFINLLDQYHSFLDLDHLLMALHACDFTVGIVWIYEKKQLFNELLYYYDDKDDMESVVSLCKRYGDQYPSLWKLALAQVSSKINNTNHEQYIKIIMGYLQHDKKIDPLHVLQTMQASSSNEICFGNVKEYFTNSLEATENQLRLYSTKITEQQDEINHMESALRNINNGVKIFQNTKCSICNKLLELPCVHFLCGHSYHNLCCENDDSCTKCQRKIKLFSDSKTTVDNKQLHSDFSNEISKNTDQIALFEKYLKLGLFSSQKSP